MASTARFDVVAIGNAIVDVLARADDALIEAEGLTKGSMRLIDGDEAERLYAAMGPAVEVSGGSAANTLAGMAALGERCAFIGQVADDQLGHVFTHDLRALGVAYETPALKEGAPTARCLILVTPDGQRTMNTFLGASHLLEQRMIDEAWIADAEILYLEGYLWDPERSRAARRRAIDVSRAAGRKVAFTLSDAFIIDRHGADFRKLIGAGLFDILFELERELDMTGYSTNDRRVFGFVSERLLDAWLITNNISYEELDIVYMEHQNWLHKGTQFLKRKFFPKKDD